MMMKDIKEITKPCANKGEINMSKKHKVFISFHHEDEKYKKRIETRYGESANGFISKSVKDGDIDPDNSMDYTRQLIRDEYIADASVTLVLVGPGTWRRKHVDWEISSSIRDTKHNPRNGLLGVLLPNYPLDRQDNYYPYTIPPRLYDNTKCKFAGIYGWPENAGELREWIHDAFLRRNKINPTNNREHFGKNIPDTESRWRD
jgi:hypothetical protein